ncbi:twin-arginine translocation signal domain-containing protein [Gluconobacter morbifer]|uniref:Twin-arginine translocation signal domain-containing protein n=1 Tax=Gluconobacter morbifer G707 TaxID=1088869 RepID=G6XHY3_9PROT|nr:twin-arginine translocation signal domain-containing protein [Gluconobacter morbifer]EHH68357.1 hypothetical protein GMO_11270 [Gluconobacter morbifer G707]
MRNPSRRGFLKAALAGSAVAGLAACGTISSSTSNGVTTIHIQNAEIISEVDTALDVAKTVLGFTSVPAAIVTAVNTAIALIEQGLAGYTAFAGTTTVLTFDSSSVPSAITSVIADIRQGAAGIAAAVTAEGANLSATLESRINSVATDVADVAGLLTSAVSAVTADRRGASSETSRAVAIEAIRKRHGLA